MQEEENVFGIGHFEKNVHKTNGIFTADQASIKCFVQCTRC